MQGSRILAWQAARSASRAKQGLSVQWLGQTKAI
jgi:hypothetical protein